MMEWSQLFSNKRLKGSVNASSGTDSDIRNSYQRDYDRIIFSAPFRKLQDKTQVFPLPGPVFVHNRLTHSLEVASAGRSLGHLAGQALVRKYAFREERVRGFYERDLAWVISSACLAHDIGNPPFGHSGEDAIRAFFCNVPVSIAGILDKHLTENQWSDLRKFEGNSMAFRMMAQEKCIYNSSFNLTSTTLASIVKYPSHSSEGFDKQSGNISRKKSGYFEADIKLFEQLAEEFGLPRIEGTGTVYGRHPFVYLTEAADDICYRIIDIEDAHRLGMVSLEKIKELFLPFFNNEEGIYAYQRVRSILDRIVTTEEKVAFLRATWIGLMIDKLAKTFMDNERQLLDGSLDSSLMDLILEDRELIDAINEYSVKHIYQHSTSIEIELGGYTILATVLEELLQAILMPERSKSRKVFQLLRWEEYDIQSFTDVYSKIMFVIDIVAGSTDSYAMDLYRKFRAISYDNV